MAGTWSPFQTPILNTTAEIPGVFSCSTVPCCPKSAVREKKRGEEGGTHNGQRTWWSRNEWLLKLLLEIRPKVSTCFKKQEHSFSFLNPICPLFFFFFKPVINNIKASLKEWREIFTAHSFVDNPFHYVIWKPAQFPYYSCDAFAEKQGRGTALKISGTSGAQSCLVQPSCLRSPSLAKAIWACFWKETRLPSWQSPSESLSSACSILMSGWTTGMWAPKTLDLAQGSDVRSPPALHSVPLLQCCSLLLSQVVSSKSHSRCFDTQILPRIVKFGVRTPIFW